MKKIFILVLILPVIVWAQPPGEISITVYNQNLALVHDIRQIDYKKGVFIYDYTEIPSQLIPTSVHFQAEKVSILEQNFEYDLSSAEKIRQKFIGTKIRAFTEDGTMFEGTLKPSEGGNIVLSDNEGKVLVLNGEQIRHTEFPRMPENFIERPTLVWLLNSETAGLRRTEVSYLSEGVNWNAEYIAITGEKRLNFSGWVSITNNCGESFENAKIKLMAGEVHRVEAPKPRYERDLGAKAFMAEGGEQPQFVEKPFFEYHLYTLQRPATLKNNQIKQISLFPQVEVESRQENVYDPTRLGDKFKVYLVFTNTEKSGLGMPLPAGKIRVYKRDEDGSQEFIGEDEIGHTPRDEKVKILVGDAFDLVGERQVVNVRTPSKNVREEDIEISLRNHKSEPADVIVREHFYGQWEIISKTHDYKKIDATTIEFSLKLPPHKAEEALSIRYTVRYTRPG